MPGGEGRDLSRAMPQFYGVAVNKKQGPFFGGFVIIAKDLDAMHDMPVSANQISAVFQHVAARGDLRA